MQYKVKVKQYSDWLLPEPECVTSIVTGDKEEVADFVRRELEVFKDSPCRYTITIEGVPNTQHMGSSGMSMRLGGKPTYDEKLRPDRHYPFGQSYEDRQWKTT